MQFNSNTYLIAHFKMKYLHTLIQLCILRYTEKQISYTYIY